MPNYPYTFQLPPLNVQDIPNDGVAGEFLGINGSGVLDWLTAGGGGTGDMLKADNLSGLASYPTARTNLGLGTGDSPTFANLTLTSPSLVSSAPVTISQTWNAGSNVMTALKVVATDTASGATSNLLELWAGSTPALKLSVGKGGSIISKVGTIASVGTPNASGLSLELFFPGYGLGVDNNGNTQFLINGLAKTRCGLGVVVASDQAIAWSSTTHTGLGPASDTILLRDGAANTLALRNGANAQTFNVYGTSSSSNTVYSRLAIACDTSGNATLTTQSTGTAGTISIGNAQKIIVGAPNNVALAFLSADINNVAFRPSGTTLEIVRGDAGAFANLKANDITVSGSLIVSNTPITSNSNIAGTNVESTSLTITTTSNGTTAAGFGTRLLYKTETDTNVLQDSGAISSVWTNAVNASRTSDMLFYNVLNGTLTERMRILGTSGNVGIGTTSPTSKLHVAGELGTNLTTFDSGAAVKITNTTATGKSWLLTSGIVNIHNEFFCIRQESVSQPALIIAPTTNNVGVGINSPPSKLTVASGDIEVSTAASGLILKSPDGTRYRITVPNGGASLTITAV